MWAANARLPRSAGDPFCEHLNRVLDVVDGRRTALPPGRYFRMLRLGRSDGMARGRFAEPAQFLDAALHEAPPDRPTVSRTRRRIDMETHKAAFTLRAVSNLNSREVSTR